MEYVCSQKPLSLALLAMYLPRRDESVLDEDSDDDSDADGRSPELVSKRDLESKASAQ